jgi:hypothetical protein
MSLDPASLDSDLRRLRPATLDERLLERLDACTEGNWTELSAAELAFEQRLRGQAPAALPASLMDSLVMTLSDVRFANEEKIVRFPHKEASSPRNNRGWWGAAAAVALTGAVTALMVPVKKQDPGPVAAFPHDPKITRPANAGSPLLPAGFKRGLSEARDEGVIWQPDHRPHRVLKVVYQDRVTLKDAAGATYQVEQPRVEYILVPARTD